MNREQMTKPENLDSLFKSLSTRVDKYIRSLKYETIIRDRDAYDKINSSLSKITLEIFEAVDPTRNIIIDIRHNLGAREITLTGYIKVYGKFIQLEHVYHS